MPDSRDLLRAQRLEERGGLSVLALPAPEDVSEREGRWITAHMLIALAVGSALTLETRKDGLRRWWFNVPLMLFIGAIGSLAATGVTRGARAAWSRVRSDELSGQRVFWLRYFTSFLASAIAFDLIGSRLEGSALWRGTTARITTVGWPLAILSLFVNATEVQAAGRLAATRLTLMSERMPLRNHNALDANLKHLMASRTLFTFIYMDLDGFKNVNDQLGHRAGDLVLAATGEVLDGLNAVPFHMHGDEFAFLVAGHDTNRIEAEVRRAYAGIRGIGLRHGVDLAATFGAAYSRVASSPDEVRHAADTEMLRAKGAGKRRLALPSRDPIILSS